MNLSYLPSLFSVTLKEAQPTCFQLPHIIYQALMWLTCFGRSYHLFWPPIFWVASKVTFMEETFAVDMLYTFAQPLMEELVSLCKRFFQRPCATFSLREGWKCAGILFHITFSLEYICFQGRKGKSPAYQLEVNTSMCTSISSQIWK